STEPAPDRTRVIRQLVDGSPAWVDDDGKLSVCVEPAPGHAATGRCDGGENQTGILAHHARARLSQLTGVANVSGLRVLQMPRRRHARGNSAIDDAAYTHRQPGIAAQLVVDRVRDRRSRIPVEPHVGRRVAPLRSEL